jgi:hypothetical protein
MTNYNINKPEQSSGVLNPRRNKELIHNFVKHLAAEYEPNLLITRSNID